MKSARRPLTWLALATLAGCGGKSPPPAAETPVRPAPEAAAVSAPAQLSDAGLVVAIRKAVGKDLGDTGSP